jgi:hypothetical protein
MIWTLQHLRLLLDLFGVKHLDASGRLRQLRDGPPLARSNALLLGIRQDRQAEPLLRNEMGLWGS